MNNNVEYIGKDLEAMDFAVNYHRWILDLIKPFLGNHLVEVGAGTGSFSEMLLETEPQTLSLVEPSEMFEVLKKRDFISDKSATKIDVYKNIFANICKPIKKQQPPDSIIYINVLEHIEDDVLELKLVNQTLQKNGRVVIFVPALSFLFSRFDKHIGHFRRYGKADLMDKCKAADFKIVSVKYFDFSGILPWYIKYRLFKSLKMESNAVQFYDKSVVPFAKFVESIIAPPIGKNLLLVAEKNS